MELSRSFIEESPLMISLDHVSGLRDNPHVGFCLMKIMDNSDALLTSASRSYWTSSYKPTRWRCELETTNQSLRTTCKGMLVITTNLLWRLDLNPVYLLPTGTVCETLMFIFQQRVGRLPYKQAQTHKQPSLPRFMVVSSKHRFLYSHAAILYTLVQLGLS